MLLLYWYRFVTVDKSSFIRSWYGALLQHDSNYLVHSNNTVAILFFYITTEKRERSQVFLLFIPFLWDSLLGNWLIRTLKSISKRYFLTVRKDNCTMLTCPHIFPSFSLMCSTEERFFDPEKNGGKWGKKSISGFNGNSAVWGTCWHKG